MRQSSDIFAYKLMVLLLVLIPVLPVHAEGPAIAGGATAPAASGFSAAGISGGMPALGAPAPAVIGAPAAGGTSVLSPLTATTNGPQAGLPPVIGEKGLAPLPTSDFAAQALTRDGKPGAAGQPQPTSAEITEISAFEKLASASDDSALSRPQPFTVGALRQFGYSFFRPEAQGFAALTDVPVGPDYLLGNGDRLSITLWGSIDGTYEVEVNRNGEIVLPKIGAVKVAGIAFGQLPAFLKGQIARVFRDFQLNITMGKLRLIKVYLVGEVKSPGDYNVSSLSTLISALAAAGGPTKDGTLRAIQVIRDGKIIETFDLYDFFLKGDKSRDIRLQQGDTIHVPIHGNLVGIGGNIRKPGIYELLKEASLKELFDMAGGVPPSSYLQRIQLSRVIANDKKLIEDFSFDPKISGKEFEARISGIQLRDMDIVKIMPIDLTVRDQVRLEGYVLRPGGYAHKPGMRVEQILSQDNLLPEYYTGAGQIVRLFPPDLHPEVLYFNVTEALAKNPVHNLELQEFDTVRIFSRWEMEEMPKVRVSGEVQKPGDYRLFNNMRVRDLLMFAGNTKITAYLKDAEINRLKKSTTSVTSYPIAIDLGEVLKDNPQHNILLEHYDELTVRKIPNWSDENDRYVTLRGEFMFPGSYPVFKGERLSAVIRRAGGFTSKAYLYGSKFTRTSVRELQQKRMDEFVTQAEIEINGKATELAATASSQEELASARATLEGVRRSLQLLKAGKAEGRMVIRLDSLDRFVNSPYDIEAMGGDVLEVPHRNNSVSVLGRVYNPTSFVSMEGSSVERYLGLAGGITNDSSEDDIYVVRADGSIFSRPQYSSLSSLFGKGFMGENVASGDVIVVPQKFEKVAWMRTIKDITTIMSQLAITAGTVILGLR
ncbi:MAG: SLBB domain-containing protein [Desulfuromonadaceae bacterium]